MCVCVCVCVFWGQSSMKCQELNAWVVFFVIGLFVFGLSTNFICVICFD